MYNKSNRITTSCLVLSHRRWSELYRWDDPLLGHSISRLDRRVTLRRSNSQAKQLGQQPELAGSQKISAVSNSALICEGSLFARTATIALPSFTGDRGTESFGQFPALQWQIPEWFTRMSSSCHGPVVQRNSLYVLKALKAVIIQSGLWRRLPTSKFH